MYYKSRYTLRRREIINMGHWSLVSGGEGLLLFEGIVTKDMLTLKMGRFCGEKDTT